MDGGTSLDVADSEFVEVDPTGRYGRYDEVLGKGASKTVYRAFDEYQGIEVAWNQVKLYEFLQSPEELERLYCEIHLLKTLKHKNIMKFYTSWVDTTNRNINFVTEMFTSGTLRQYRLKHKRVNIRAVKHWCRQILEGLLYLHSHDPPVIHRDLKCDNIFINGNQGEVKIGDLGLAAILRKAHAVCCVGTPEFMAPEVYEEEYNELVDIYSFGMCILEMVTFEYPYSECTHPAQIYKKVVSGKKPEALYKVKDPEVRQFVEKCLVAVSSRLPAKELLRDPFLQIDDYEYDLRPLDYYEDYNDFSPYLREPIFRIHRENPFLTNGNHDSGHDPDNNLDYQFFEYERGYSSPFTSLEEHVEDLDVMIKGRQEDDGIFLRLRIADKEGRIRNIYFPFDIQTDTALSVATEMVTELDITDHDVTKIADMIDGELTALVPEWKSGLIIDESVHGGTNASFCHNCASYGSMIDPVSSNSTGVRNLQVLSSSNNECATIHGRFEEIMYRVEGKEDSVTEYKPEESNKSSSVCYADIWAQRDKHELSLNKLGDIYDNEARAAPENSRYQEAEKVSCRDDKHECKTRYSSSSVPSSAHTSLDDNENEIRQELRWLKAKYQIQLRELRDQQLGIKAKLVGSLTYKNLGNKKLNISLLSLVSDQPKEEKLESILNLSSCEKQFTSDLHADSQDATQANSENESFSPREMVTVKSFYTDALSPHSLHRATSLPVDAVDV